MSGSFNARGELDIGDGRLILCVGKKRSGKSVMALVIFRSFPWDKIVIDVAGDDGPAGPGVIEIHGTVDELPRRWPEEQRENPGQPMILRYVPDAGSPTMVEDMDAVVALALAHGRSTGHCGLLVHEMGVLAKSGSTPPATRRLLMHNRHNSVTGIFCCPRMIGVDPLVGGQADLVYGFDLPQLSDRKRLAEDIGWPIDELSAAFHGLQLHEYLRYDANEPKPEHEDDEDWRLVHFPPLPADVVDATKRWADGREQRP